MSKGFVHDIRSNDIMMTENEEGIVLVGLSFDWEDWRG